MIKISYDEMNWLWWIGDSAHKQSCAICSGSFISQNCVLSRIAEEQLKHKVCPLENMCLPSNSKFLWASDMTFIVIHGSLIYGYCVSNIADMHLLQTWAPCIMFVCWFLLGWLSFQQYFSQPYNAVASPDNVKNRDRNEYSNIQLMSEYSNTFFPYSYT